MTTLKFHLHGQNITLANKGTTIASDSKNYLVAQFNALTDDWNYPITAIFKNSNMDNSYTTTVGANEDLAENECLVPWEVLTVAGTVSVSAYCDDLHTAVCTKFKVNKSGYTEDSLTASEALQMCKGGTKRIYFKLNCENWTAPRAYLFNSTYTAAPYAHCYLEAWAWTDSPYMTASGRDKDLYYLDIPLNYEKVIFFCDVEHADGINYKTSDLILPSDSQYRLPCYYQSPIGYNGIWGDVETKKITVYIQSRGEGCSTVEDEVPTATVDNKSYVLNRIGHIGTGVGSAGLYYSIDIPAECSTITLTKGDITADFELWEICYNMPIFYVDKWTDTDNPAWRVFDGTIDNSFIWHTRYSQSEWKLYQELYSLNSSQINTALANSNYATITTGTKTGEKDYDYHSNVDGSITATVKLIYYKIGKLCTCQMIMTLVDTLKDSGAYSAISVTALPYTPAYADSSLGSHYQSTIFNLYSTISDNATKNSNGDAYASITAGSTSITFRYLPRINVSEDDDDLKATSYFHAIFSYITT